MCLTDNKSEKKEKTEDIVKLNQETVRAHGEKENFIYFVFVEAGIIRIEIKEK